MPDPKTAEEHGEHQPGWFSQAYGAAVDVAKGPMGEIGNTYQAVLYGGWNTQPAANRAAYEHDQAIAEHVAREEQQQPDNGPDKGAERDRE